MEEKELSYIAGFFDGEGSIGLYLSKRKSNSYVLRTQLTQNVSPIVTTLFEKLKSKWGGNLSTQTTLSGKIKYNWQLNTNGAEVFLKDIVGYLTLKKSQAELALEWISKRPSMTRDTMGRISSTPIEFINYSREVSNKLKGLKG